jgi:hypothetical protein
VPPGAAVINAILPHPPGLDPATQLLESLGNPGESFDGVLVSIEGDAAGPGPREPVVDPSTPRRPGDRPVETGEKRRRTGGALFPPPPVAETAAYPPFGSPVPPLPLFPSLRPFQLGFRSCT